MKSYGVIGAFRVTDDVRRLPRTRRADPPAKAFDGSMSPVVPYSSPRVGFTPADNCIQAALLCSLRGMQSP